MVRLFWTLEFFSLPQVASQKKRKQRSGGWSAHTRPSSKGRVFKGELNGNGALVKDAKDVEDLWRCGCFGKGMMSRSVAERFRGGGGKGMAKEKKTTAETPFHGSGRIKDARPLLGVSNEPIQLTPQEVVYLVHVERCLDVGKSLEELWAYFSVFHERFVLVYFAYHHYRSMGWIVRAGSKMGVDLVLYEDHPGRVHATHSVLIRNNNVRTSVLSWPELLGIGRVSENVRKTLIFCNVNLNGECLEDVLATSTLEELSYKRWATNRTRGGQEGDEPDWSDD